MSFNRRKMEDQRREAAEKEAASQRATDAQVLEDADRLIAAWNERHAKRMPMIFSPTIGAAITDVQNSLIAKLEERPWRTDILKVDGHQLYISGGSRQGLHVGDTLFVLKQGERVKSAQTGFDITLPAKRVGQIRITSLFGSNETDEGAVADILSGDISDAHKDGLYVSEKE